MSDENQPVIGQRNLYRIRVCILAPHGYQNESKEVFAPTVEEAEKLFQFELESMGYKVNSIKGREFLGTFPVIMP